MKRMIHRAGPLNEPECRMNSVPRKWARLEKGNLKEMKEIVNFMAAWIFFFFIAVTYTMTKNNWEGKGLLSACSGSPLLRAGQELKAEAEDMEEHCLWAASSCFFYYPEPPTKKWHGSQWIGPSSINLLPKSARQTCIQAIWGRHLLNWVYSSQLTLTCVKFTVSQSGHWWLWIGQQRTWLHNYLWSRT